MYSFACLCGAWMLVVISKTVSELLHTDLELCMGRHY